MEVLYQLSSLGGEARVSRPGRLRTPGAWGARGRGRPPPWPELADRAREETREERADRNVGELLSELHVALPSVQVLFAFLLVVPINRGFTRMTDVERKLYACCSPSPCSGTPCRCVGAASRSRDD